MPDVLPWVIVIGSILGSIAVAFFAGRTKQAAEHAKEERDEALEQNTNLRRPMPTPEQHVRSAERRLHELRKARRSRVRGSE